MGAPSCDLEDSDPAGRLGLDQSLDGDPSRGGSARREEQRLGIERLVNAGRMRRGFGTNRVERRRRNPQRGLVADGGSSEALIGVVLEILGFDVGNAALALILAVEAQFERHR